MKKFIMLLNEELKRGARFYLLALIVLVGLELVSVVYQILSFQSEVEQYMKVERVSQLEAIRLAGGLFGFGDATAYFQYIIAIAMMLTFLLAFQIWYRDWFGESKYIYRLLMLPGRRFTILLSKLTAVMLTVASFIGVQWVVILVSGFLFRSMTPDDLMESKQLFGENRILSMFYTFNIVDTLIILLVTALVVSFVFLVVLIERSYRKRIAILQVMLDAALLIIPLVGLVYFFETTHLLHPNQITTFVIGYPLLYFVYVYWKSIRLLNHKISI